MPSTYSPNLRIELVANGEQTGTWGSTTNNNLGTLIESAIASHITFDIEGAAVKYLQALNGVNDQARKMAVTFIGASSNFRVYVPPAQKVYIFRNDTDYTAEIATSTAPNGITKTAGTEMVTIPAQRTAWVFCDTTNNVRTAVDYIDGDLSVSGNLGVDGAIAADSLSLAIPLPAESGGVPTPVNATNAFLTNVDGVPVWGVTGIKTVVCATTADHPLLGLTAVDGISLLAGYRVLVKNQTNAEENGIYVADLSSWTRADDFNTPARIAGSFVNVLDGNTQGGFQYATNFKASDTLDTDPMDWVRVEPLPTQTGNTSKVLTTTGTEAAWVSPAAKTVYAATTANLTSLSGLSTTVDGVALNTAGMRVLVKNQTAGESPAAAGNGPANGIYVVAAGAWTRAPDAATALDLAGSVVAVQAGTTQGGLQYATTFKSTDTLGTTTMTWNPLVTGTIVSGVSSFSAGTTGLTPSSPSGGGVVLGGTLGAANGGTSFSTYATGDILYASATNTLAKLAGGTANNGKYLTISGGVPVWGTVNAGLTSFTINTSTSGTLAGGATVSTSGQTVSLSIATGGVGATQLASNAVTEAKIASNAVTTAKIADAAVTPAKLSGAQTGSAPAYVARAWVQFNASTGTPIIAASGNVSSITDSGVGLYRIVFTTAMPNANYAVVGTSSREEGDGANAELCLSSQTAAGGAPSTASVGISVETTGGSQVDRDYNSVAIFG